MVQGRLTAEIRPLEEYMEAGFAEMARLKDDMFRLSNLERAQFFQNTFTRESIDAKLKALDEAKDNFAGRVTAVEAVLLAQGKAKDIFAGRLAKVEADLTTMSEAGHLLG